MINSRFLNWSKDLVPALVVLVLSLAGAFIYGDFAPFTKWPADAWIVVFRFLKFAIILCLPLFVLPKVYLFILSKFSHHLVQLNAAREKKLKPFVHWLSRPLQGIGIGLVFSTKLLTVLQLISGPVDSSIFLIAEGPYPFGRLVVVSLVTAGVSFFLSALWAFDDTGVRYYLKKDQEIKMIGKFVGTVVPFTFSIYGMLNLMANYSTYEALQLVIKIALVLYPPMTVFVVFHFYFVTKKIGLFANNKLNKVSIHCGL